jgi:hypothetical protein
MMESKDRWAVRVTPHAEMTCPASAAAYCPRIDPAGLESFRRQLVQAPHGAQ